MIDDIDTTKAAISARLRDAGLIDLAERVARREGLKLAHLIETDNEPTGAHVTLWKALAKEGLAPATISKLLGWPAATIAAELGQAIAAATVPKATPVTAPTPAPKAAPPARSPLQEQKEIRALIEAAVAPLRAELANTRAKLADLTERLAAPELLERRLESYGPVGAVIRETAARHGVPAAAIMAGGHVSVVVMRARYDVIAELTTGDAFRWPARAIATLLNLELGAVLFCLRKLGLKAAGLRYGKAAA